MIEILIGLLVVVFYLIGGQINKAVRRYGVPVSLYGMTWASSKDKSKAQRIKEIVLLSLIGLLSMGYGQDSKLNKWLKHDWLVRIVYGLLLSVPLLIIKFVWFVPIILSGAWSIRAGSLFSFKIKDRQFDILIEDIVRSVALFTSVYIVIR